MIDSIRIQAKILKKQAAVKWTLGVLAFLFLLLGFIVYFFSSLPDSFSFLSLMKGYENGFNYSISLTYSVYRILLFFLIILSCTAVSNEAQNGTLKTILVKRLRRDKLIVGKAISLFIFFSLVFLIIYLTSSAAGGILYGFGDISEKSYIIHSGVSLFINSFLAFFLIVFPLFALINFSIFFSVLFNNNILPLISCFGLNFIFYILGELNIFKAALLTNYLFFPLKTFQKMARGLPLIWSPEVWQMIFVTSVYSIIFLVLSIVFFKRKELR